MKNGLLTINQIDQENSILTIEDEKSSRVFLNVEIPHKSLVLALAKNASQPVGYELKKGKIESQRLTVELKTGDGILDAIGAAMEQCPEGWHISAPPAEIYCDCMNNKCYTTVNIEREV